MFKQVSGLIAASILSFPAMALTINGSGLQNAVDGFTLGGPSSIDVTTDYLLDSQDSIWATGSGGSITTFVAELSGWADRNTFGIYGIGGGPKVELFSAADGAGDKIALSIGDGSIGDHSVFLNFVDTGVDLLSDFFGFYITTPEFGGITYYSETSRNTDNFDHMAAYQGTGDNIQLPGSAPSVWLDTEYLLAWEDLSGSHPGNDQDYNDLMVFMNAYNHTVPEPSAIALMGLGLLGLGFRKFAKK